MKLLIEVAFLPLLALSSISGEAGDFGFKSCYPESLRVYSLAHYQYRSSASPARSVGIPLVRESPFSVNFL